MLILKCRLILLPNVVVRSLSNSINANKSMKVDHKVNALKQLIREGVRIGSHIILFHHLVNAHTVITVLYISTILSELCV